MYGTSSSPYLPESLLLPYIYWKTREGIPGRVFGGTIQYFITLHDLGNDVTPHFFTSVQEPIRVLYNEEALYHFSFACEDDRTNTHCTTT